MTKGERRDAVAHKRRYGMKVVNRSIITIQKALSQKALAEKQS